MEIDWRGEKYCKRWIERKESLEFGGYPKLHKIIPWTDTKF